MEEALLVAQAVRDARDWVNLPAADLRPPEFADAVVAAGKKLGRGTKVTVKVFDEKQLAELGCGGILGVGGGRRRRRGWSSSPTSPRDAVAHLALVGKGVTYDSGGLSIKPATGMTTMKCDMAGAAAVVQATFAIAKLGLPVKVSAFAPMAENMVSGSAMRPGDVITQYGGTTVEVLNTDAEGRLILADALVRATERQPDVILDVATLTGHMVIALGDRLAGVLGSDEVVGGVLAAGETAGEAMWPMPIPDAIVERVKASKIADLLQHDGIRWGGGLFAAAYLREFTAGLPWAHLDIAGPAFNTGGPYGHLTSGGTGFAVATLVDYARSLADCAVVEVDGRHARASRPTGRHRVSRPALAPSHLDQRAALQPLLLLAAVVVAHPLGDADDGGVVRRDLVLVAELVRPVDRRDAASGPLAVVGDEQQRDVADRGARLDEALDATVGGHELEQVPLVGGVGGAHAGRAGAGGVTRGGAHADARATAEPVEQPHAP